MTEVKISQAVFLLASQGPVITKLFLKLMHVVKMNVSYFKLMKNAGFKVTYVVTAHKSYITLTRQSTVVKIGKGKTTNHKPTWSN